MSLIKEFTIKGLNGRANVSIKLRGRHCVIVGPNGSGKSTALQIFAYSLGRQWKKLSKMRFDEINIVFEDGDEAVLDRFSCMSLSRLPLRTWGDLLQDKEYQLDFLEPNGSGKLVDFDIFTSLSSAFEVTNFEHKKGRAAKVRLSEEFRKLSENIAKFSDVLKAKSVPSVLYLPTYRRIELELASVLGDSEERYRAQVANPPKTGISTEFLVELVRFGMEDVTTLIQLFERQTRDFARNRFNKMMTSYLKEMANSNVISVGDLRSRRIDASTISMVLSRIEEGLLSSEEKKQISDIILDLSSTPGAGNQPFNKKWLAHFFVRLMEVNSDIENRERAISDLVRTLGKYFDPKTVSYDIESYHFAIKDPSGDELKLSDLSSGEKQLVSILCQLHLQEAGKRFFVLIDEPELSLSVPWQSDFLPDVATASACSQIIAVTHSPFIYDNALRDMVVDFVANSAG